MGLLFFILAACAHETPSSLPDKQDKKAVLATRNLKVKDEIIEANIGNLVRLANLELLSLDVNSRGGRVSVSGKVPDELTKRDLIAAIGNLKGVRGVSSQLVVSDAGPEVKAENKNWLGFLFDLLAVPLILALIPISAVVLYVETRLAAKLRKERKSAQATRLQETRPRENAA